MELNLIATLEVRRQGENVLKIQTENDFKCRILFPNCYSKVRVESFPGGSVVKNPPANAGDTGSSPGPGRSHMPRSN